MHKNDKSESCCAYPENTKDLYNICTTSTRRLRRWSNIVQMVYKYNCYTNTNVYWVTFTPILWNAVTLLGENKVI